MVCKDVKVGAGMSGRRQSGGPINRQLAHVLYFIIIIKLLSLFDIFNSVHRTYRYTNHVKCSKKII